METFVVQSFGCRASQADGAVLEEQLARRGMERAGSTAEAKFVILNTCTVTAAADDEIRRTVRRIHRENRETRIVITGCYAQRAPAELAALPGVTLVAGNSHKSAIADLLMNAPFHGEVYVSDIFAVHEFTDLAAGDALSGRSRPNLKIQDGCNNRCSFCVIPFVRGRSRSMSPELAIESVRKLSSRAAEIVLTGINLGRWGREPGATMRLADLLRRMLDETSIGRIRLSSVEPMDLSGELLELMASTPRIARHVHAPLQSGSDSVLRRMHRKYRPRHYEDRIRIARALMPDAAIGADVMAGFPGETAEEFNETLQFIEALPFTYLHVFPFSERPGTPAAGAGGQVPLPVRHERVRILKELGTRKNLEFRRSMVGRTLPIATLEDGEAITSNYLKVQLAYPRPPRQLDDAIIGGISESGLIERGALRIL